MNISYWYDVSFCGHVKEIYFDFFFSKKKCILRISTEMICNNVICCLYYHSSCVRLCLCTKMCRAVHCLDSLQINKVHSQTPCKSKSIYLLTLFFCFNFCYKTGLAILLSSLLYANERMNELQQQQNRKKK